MEMLFATIGGALFGAIFSYTIPGRSTYGSMLLPAVGTVVAAVVWAGLTWLGWKFDGGWIWVATLLASGLVTLAIAVWLPSRRRRSDAQLLESLTTPQQPVRV